MSNSSEQAARLGHRALLLLIVAVFALDFFHGITLGKHGVLFEPVYRLRQSLAIAISRLHDEPAGGYLAHGSVIKSLIGSGLAILPEDGRPVPDAAERRRLLNDTAALNAALRDAQHVRIDRSLMPEIIGGNELGLADYAYLGFVLFGTRGQSLYDLLFLLIGLSAVCYAAQFRRSPFMLLLLAWYLCGLYWLQDYAAARDPGLNTIANTRLFSGISLLPAAHIFFVVMQRRPASTTTVLMTLFQCALLVFLLACRDEIMWQVLMIFAVGIVPALIELIAVVRRRSRYDVLQRAQHLWPVACLALLMLANTWQKELMTDGRYAAEPKGHVFWHTVLAGILYYNPDLQARYAPGSNDNVDQIVYRAITNDLNARQDRTSPIAHIHDGRIEIDQRLGRSHYDRLARSLVLRILRHDTLAVIRGLAPKAENQLRAYRAFDGFGFSSVAVPLLLAGLAALACGAAGGLRVTRGAMRTGLGTIAAFLAFASITPAIFPAFEAAGTVLTFMIAMLAAASALISILVHRALPHLPCNSRNA